MGDIFLLKFEGTCPSSALSADLPSSPDLWAGYGADPMEVNP